MKKYKCGLIIGRFQPMHLGHLALIEKAYELCDYLIIGIGSAEEYNTKRNPFPISTRIKWVNDAIHGKYTYIQELFDHIKIIPLVNIGAGDSPIWGNYVMNTCLADNILDNRNFPMPEVYFSGTEVDRNHWFENYDMKFEVLDRNDIKISSTQIRELILKDDKSWVDLVPELDPLDLKCIPSFIKKVNEVNEND